jgi:hypothetical protein
MEQISTFQATTVTATSIFFFLSCFLRGSSGLDLKCGSPHRSHRSDRGFHKEIYRAQSGFDPRIKQTVSPPMCTKGWIRCTVWPATTN